MTNYQILDPKLHPPGQSARLSERRIPPSLESLAASAPFFQPSPALVEAVNVALAVGAPLLLTGEPGTGKTQLAHYLAWYFELGPENGFYELDVRSTTTWCDLLYEFDSVAYFHAAQDSARAGKTVTRGEFVRKGPLWKAIESDGPSLLLLDEIDKAPRDFPNDLLGVLSRSSFYVPEQEKRIERPNGTPPPFVVITSNSERRLPEPFLRRCIFHHIEFSEELLRKAVHARRGDFASLASETVEAGVSRLMDLRAKSLRKKPATAEFLVWLTVLAAQGGVTVAEVRDCRLAELPALSALIKDRDDLAAL